MMMKTNVTRRCIRVASHTPIRTRIADGLRMISFGIRYPQKLVEVIQLSKEVAESGLCHTLDKDKLTKTLLGSDEDIRVYVESEIWALSNTLSKHQKDEIVEEEEGEDDIRSKYDP